MRASLHTEGFILAGIAAAVTVCAYGQAYPNKPVRIVTAEVGGGDDYSARVIAQGLTPALGQQVVVENRGGSSMRALKPLMNAFGLPGGTLRSPRMPVSAADLEIVVKTVLRLNIPGTPPLA